MINDVARRLPNGEMTRDALRFFNEWQKITDKAENFYPGYKVVSSDPGITLEKRDDDFRLLDRVSLSVHAVNALTVPKPNEDGVFTNGGWVE
jgi:histidinol phosphatase-like PHP family hydrolase